MGAEYTLAPLESFTEKVAPASLALAMRYARLVVLPVA